MRVYISDTCMLLHFETKTSQSRLRQAIEAVMNICGKFHSNSSTKYRYIMLREINVNDRPNDLVENTTPLVAYCWQLRDNK